MGPVPPLTPGLKSLEDWRALPEDARIELIDGGFVEKAAPTSEHSLAQVHLDRAVGSAFHRRGDGSGKNGGWWILAEVDVALSSGVFRPDLCGWQRDRVPELPKTRPVDVRPDWVCEILSESNRANDTVLKFRRYHQAGIPHYWLVDPEGKSVVVHRWMPEGYLVVKNAVAGEFVRLEPFEALELRIGLLFGEDPDDPPAPPPTAQP